MRFLTFFVGLILASGHAFGTTTLNSSLLMFSLEDAQTCAQKVEGLKSDDIRILFVPTLYFLQSRHKVKNYCSFQAGQCRPMSQAIIESYRSAWSNCFSYAAKNGVRISVMPHLDDGSGKNQWRNDVEFDALKKLDGFSYFDMMIQPLAKALEDAARIGAGVIDFAMMGEMGAPIFSHPQPLLQIFSGLKSKHPDWQLGLSLNHNSVNGKSKNADVAATQSLFDHCDFIGISAYHAVHVPVLPEDFATTISDFKSHLADLHVLVSPEQRFHFSEIGLGGGNDTLQGIKPATQPAQTAKNPWAGYRIWPYDPSKDPWRIPELKQFRFQFYEALTQYMSRPAPETHLVRVFNWSDGPWNYQTNFPNVYGDPDIQASVRRYNETIPPLDQ